MTTPATHYLRGEDSHWRCCCLLYHDYARRREQAYIAFQAELWQARERHISTSHLRFMIGAWLTYRDLRAALGVQAVAPLRRQLPFTYFARAGQSLRAHDLTPRDVLHALQQAARGELENTTQLQDALTAESHANGDQATEPNGRAWMRTSIYPALVRFAETPPVDVPERIVYHARELARLAGEWLNETSAFTESE